MDILIESLIVQNLRPELFELVNESGKHKGHSGDDGSGQTHYVLKIVSPVFEGMSRVQRHQKVLSLLKPAFEQGLHAVSLKLSSPQENA